MRRRSGLYSGALLTFLLGIMKVAASKFTENHMSFYRLILSDGRKTYCRSFSGEFDKRTQSAARGVIDAQFHIRPNNIHFEIV